MKISFNWLKELVALPAGVGPDEVARRLTLAGLEVESIERRGRDVTGVKVCEVRGVRPHPDAEKLRIVKVSTGAAHEEEVVCGAPNVPAAGGRVAWAAPGATLPGGLQLGRKQVRGFDSPGMLCSERELGLGDAVDGILILSTDAAPGTDLASYLGLADDVFEVNVTPNRADALSHAGIAREVAALFGVSWKLPPVGTGQAARTAGETGEAQGEEQGRAAVTVDIRDAAACPRYQATVVRGLRVGPSPLGVRMRLAACGVRAISNLVDVTNYVMLETGHPLHAFDLDKLRPAPAIIVRRAASGESMRTLDGVDRLLEPTDIVIADERGAVALAGVMGGATSEVSGETTNVLLEAATFDPRSVRRTAKRLGMHSEASHRFERGVDAVTVPVAGARAAAMMAALGGGHVAGAPIDKYVAPVAVRQVTLPLATLRRVAGFDVSVETATAKLRSVEIGVTTTGDGGQGGVPPSIVATVPTFRPDISIAEDLVEEVMRLVGYDQVPVRLPGGGKAPLPSPDRLADRASDLLAALGLHEIAGWAFVSRPALTALGDPALVEGIAVKNPISSDYEVMRTSLLPGLAEAARRNLAHGVTDVRLFEVGPVIRPAGGETHHVQFMCVAGLLSGRRAGWLKPGEPVDFYDAKTVVVELLKHLCGVDPHFVANAGTSHPSPILHPGVSAEIHATGAVSGAPPVGIIGQLHPSVARAFGIEVPAFVFELQLDRLPTAEATVRAAAPPRFPAVTRDVSFWIDATISAESQRAAMRISTERLLREIAVLEDFRDPRFVASGKKGMLWTLTYRADDRTLTDTEVDSAHAAVVAALCKSFHIDIR